jgi:hypothetical protein
LIDTNVTIRKWLISDTALTSIVPANRIAFPDLPEGAAPEKGEKWLTFRSRGGEAHPEAPIVRADIQVTAWAKTSLEARAIYRAVFDLLHLQWQDGGQYFGSGGIDLGADGFVYSSREQIQGQDVLDPDTGWNLVVMFFEVQMRATA